MAGSALSPTAYSVTMVGGANTFSVVVPVALAGNVVAAGFMQHATATSSSDASNKWVVTLLNGSTSLTSAGKDSSTAEFAANTYQALAVNQNNFVESASELTFTYTETGTATDLSAVEITFTVLVQH